MKICEWCQVKEVKTNRNRFCSNTCSTRYKQFNHLYRLHKLPTYWNKGLTKETDERVAHQSEKIKGRASPFKGKTYEEIYGEIRGKEMRLIHSGEGNGMYHKVISVEARAFFSRKTKEAILNGKLIPLNNSFHGGGFRKDLGIFLRSSWEANVIRILNYFNVDWEYEKKRFVLSNGTIYIDDIYLPKFDLYIEIKGWCFNNINKLKLFHSDYPDINLKVIDSEVYNRLTQIFSNKVVNWEFPRKRSSFVIYNHLRVETLH